MRNYEEIREKVHFRRRDDKWAKLWTMAMERAVGWAREAGIRAVVGDQGGNGEDEENEEEQQQQQREDEDYSKYLCTAA